jgi:hypothetical protein
MSIPSCLSAQDEDDIIRAFEKVLKHHHRRTGSANAVSV